MKNSNFNKIAKEVISTEIKGLKKLKKSFDKSFLKALDVISKCNGKVILAGIGKSGLICRKISSTLCSIGISSFYLHPSEASHGDLGMISKKDILMMLSYSGETEELKSIIRYANRHSIKIIGVASKRNSLLLRSSDIKIILPEVKEAGIGNLVPSTSTTTMLVFGDSLAVCLMHISNFSTHKFKSLHPHGSLGKKLISVKDIMFTDKDIPLINENTNMKDAIALMTKKKLGCLVAKNKKNFVTGFCSDGDLRRKSKNDLINKKLKDIMTKNPLWINESTLAAKALGIMNRKKVTTLLVTNDHNFNKKKRSIKIKGLLHIHELLKRGIN